jgi:hypothetical protein
MKAKRPPTDRALKVLFIGNSFTARNNLPFMVAELAAAAGVQIEHRLVSAGGASLRMHWNKGEAPEALRQGGFDYVVLQEQSTLPVKNATRMHENVRLFDAAIKAAGAKTVLYMTWARKHQPSAQKAITDAYNSIGRELGALVVPAGVAWERFMAKHDEPPLHDKDQSHPTVAGTYLAACAFFGVFLGRSPEGIDAAVPGLDVAARTNLQKAAWAAVKASG